MLLQRRVSHMLSRGRISKRFFGAVAHATYCGFTHPRRKQYHVAGYTYEQGGPLVTHSPSGMLSCGYGSLVGTYVECPPGLGKEGKWDYDGFVAMFGAWLIVHVAWYVLTLMPGGPTVGYDFGQVKNRHPNNMAELK